MAEHVIVRQDADFRTQFWVEAETEDGKGILQEALQVLQLNPYSMMLASWDPVHIVLNTYAEHHHMSLEGVEIELFYNVITQGLRYL